MNGSAAQLAQESFYGEKESQLLFGLRFELGSCMQERCVHSALYLERVQDEYELDWGKQHANKTNEDRGGQVESWPSNAKSRTWRGWSMWGPGIQSP